jgi:hypothetical protein
MLAEMGSNRLRALGGGMKSVVFFAAAARYFKKKLIFYFKLNFLDYFDVKNKM